MMAAREAAKYPFLGEAVNHLDSLGLTLEDLASPPYRNAVARATSRVLEAIKRGEVSARLGDPETEFVSYPIAAMLVAVAGEPFLSRRFALAEATRAHKLLLEEPLERLIAIAREEFQWEIQPWEKAAPRAQHSLSLGLANYLGCASGFKESKWKLVNRLVDAGYVAVTPTEVARLLQVEVERWVLERVSQETRIALPPPLEEALNQVKKVFQENRSKLGAGALPDSVVNEAFPPCIQYCLEGLLAGRRASHMERFTLTSFLVNVGMPLDQIVGLYTSVTDFDEALTRYQIEHIAGLKGNRTKYTPPTCNTLRTHGICVNPDNLCKQVSHPLSYYRRKARQLAAKKPEPLNTSRGE